MPPWVRSSEKPHVLAALRACRTPKRMLTAPYTPCFAGTRVPIQTLMDYLRSGDRIVDFLDDFPTVQREQVEAVLDVAGDLAAPVGLVV
jgi:hypothetical protein